MALNIKDPETDRLVREFAKLTGRSMTEAVKSAVKDGLEREMRRRGKNIDRAQIRKIVDRINSYPLRDNRPADEILGYDDRGLPG